LVRAVEKATIGALPALGANHFDPTALAPHIASMTAFVDALRSLELTVYLTFFDAVLGRLLIAAGQPETARTRLDAALQLARDTGMHFYDAELIRLRAQTQAAPESMRANIRAAIDLARRQGATLFELRVANPRAPVSSTPSAASPRAARSRNWRESKGYFGDCPTT
jgi:hypothetical protein